MRRCRWAARSCRSRGRAPGYPCTGTEHDHDDRRAHAHPGTIRRSATSPTPAIQGPLWQSFIANGRLVEWHFFSDANHGFRHPDNDGFQPHYADLVWPLVTDFLQRTV
ncbi:MAG: hypothetical protein DME15_05710 [Candidatus Rokuibacteriota bacterium]|nr:MAG: hypothetical protein DME15_05710 [Candidatus Rokubacteria bacterium]